MSKNNRSKVLLNFKITAGIGLPLFLFAFLLVFSGTAHAQGTTVKPQPQTPRVPPQSPKPMPKVAVRSNVVRNETGTPAEKFIAVDPKVNVTLCVTKGNVRINGWDREEVRAFVADGSEVGFKVVEKSQRTSQPVWIYVLGFDPATTKAIKPEECLTGEDIEIDVPRGAAVTLKGREAEIRISSVRKASVKNIAGDIYLGDISEGLEASTYEGDVSVESSTGMISVESSTGNIVVVDAGASEIGDTFRAKTNNGAIVLQNVTHRQLETNSITGTTNYTGTLRDAGQYTFSSSNGSILLNVPAESSVRVSASFGFGAFSSEIPMKDVLKKEQSLSATLGDGGASLNVKTFSGAITIRKK